MDIRPIGSMIQPGSGIAEKNMPGTESVAAVKPAIAPVVAVAAIQQPEPVENAEQLKQAVKNINQALQEQSQNLEFSIDSDSGRTIVTVVDQQTKTVIRQMPSKEALEIAKSLDKLQSLLIRQKA
jgi:flagellar protein FlaG